MSSNPMQRVVSEVIVVDLDGTLTNASYRAKQYLQPGHEDWDAFYMSCGADAPIKPVIEIISDLGVHYDIVLCSGRRESCRETTMAWLEEFAPDLNYCALLLRKDGDKRHDVEVKPELLDNYIKTCKHRTAVRAVFEDRDSMVAKWRELGYTCFQPAPGNF